VAELEEVEIRREELFADLVLERVLDESSIERERSGLERSARKRNEVPRGVSKGSRSETTALATVYVDPPKGTGPRLKSHARGCSLPIGCSKRISCSLRQSQAFTSSP